MSDEKDNVERDTVRCEGVYASLYKYAGTDLVRIERVCGDCTILELSITEDEGADLIEQLAVLLKIKI